MRQYLIKLWHANYNGYFFYDGFSVDCILFCRNPDKRAHVSQIDFKTLKWLPISDRSVYC